MMKLTEIRYQNWQKTPFFLLKEWRDLMFWTVSSATSYTHSDQLSKPQKLFIDIPQCPQSFSACSPTPFNTFFQHSSSNLNTALWNNRNEYTCYWLRYQTPETHKKRHLGANAHTHLYTHAHTHTHTHPYSVKSMCHWVSSCKAWFRCQTLSDVCECGTEKHTTEPTHSSHIPHAAHASQSRHKHLLLSITPLLSSGSDGFLYPTFYGSIAFITYII